MTAMDEAPPRRVVFGNGRDTSNRWLPHSELAAAATDARSRIESWAVLQPWRAELASLVALQVSTKAEVYAFESSPRPIVLKLVHSEERYERELFAYALLEPYGVTPRVLATDDAHRCLLMEHAGRPFRLESIEDGLRAIEVLARVHAVAIAEQTLLGELFPERTIRHFSANLADMLAIPDEPCFREAMQQLATIDDVERVPFAIFDLKDGHMCESAGQLRLIDLETLSPGFPELFDLLQLLNLSICDWLPSAREWRVMLHRYLTVRMPGTPPTGQRVHTYFTAIAMALRAFKLERLIPDGH